MKLKTTQKGFTLIELLVGLSIAVFVTGAASMTIITMMRLSPQTNNWAIALRQVQNTGYWISRDVMMSQTIVPGTGSTFLTLTQPQIQTPAKTVVYEFQVQPISGERWLIRTESIGGSIVGQTAIAQYISEPIQYNYDPDSDQPYTLTFTITATSGNVPVTRQYEATQRVPAASP
ncbi:MAG: prepilin-type N-terminal cleavage/methylation domain-containing protein [Dehalococcoidia bacterium]